MSCSLARVAIELLIDKIRRHSEAAGGLCYLNQFRTQDHIRGVLLRYRLIFGCRMDIDYVVHR